MSLEGLDDMRMEKNREALYKHLEKRIGHTPLYEIKHIAEDFRKKNKIRIFAKEEYRNPTGSHYDRVYLTLLRELEKSGTIRPGQTLIEATSGNAGASFAWLCRILGFKPLIVISKGMPNIRPLHMFFLGGDECKIIFSEKGKYAKGAADRLKDVIIKDKKLPTNRRKKIWCPNHAVDYNAILGMKDCGQEIISELKKNSTKLDYFVPALGAGVHVRGIGEKFREDGYTKDVKIVGTEPFEAPDNFRKKYPKRFKELFKVDPEKFELKSHGLLGSGSWAGGSDIFVHIREVLKWENFEDIVLVKPENWRATKEDLIFKECKHVGRTSAACLWASLEYAKRNDITNKNFLIIFYDPAWKYLHFTSA